MNDESMPPSLAELLDEARRQAPSAAPELCERVHERVKQSIATAPAGTALLTRGGVIKGGVLAVLVGAGAVTFLQGDRGASSAPPASNRSLEQSATLLNEPGTTESIEPQGVTSPSTNPALEQVEPAPKPIHRSSEVARPRAAAKPPAPSDELAREAAMIEGARELLSKDPRRALAMLAKHKLEFPAGQLGEERELLCIRAYAGAGDTKAARAGARAFLEEHPRSPHRQELEQIGTTP